VASDPGMDETIVLVDQIQPVQLARKLAAAQEHTGWGRFFEPQYKKWCSADIAHAELEMAVEVDEPGRLIGSCRSTDGS
jgi:hypothetical protein